MTPKSRTRPDEGDEGAANQASKEVREAELARLATRQHGVIGRRQLQALGFGPDTIKRWLRAGRLHRLHREAFSVGHARVSRRGLWLAAVLACGEDALLSHRAAAALWGLAAAPGATFDVTSPAGRQYRPGRLGICLHRGRLNPEDYAASGPIPVTTVARTLFDFAEVVDFGRLEKAWEEADRLHLLRLRAVEDVCERGYGRRALKPIRRLLAEARAATTTRSPLEDRFQRFCDAYELPPRATNVDVLGHEVDVLWPAARLIVELDSWEHHGHRAAFERDRARDPKLLLAGYRTLRVTHRRLDREPAKLATEIRQLLNPGIQSPPLNQPSPEP
jgi:predicted transcriptional regulator of viral defense system